MMKKIILCLSFATISFAACAKNQDGDLEKAWRYTKTSVHTSLKSISEHQLPAFKVVVGSFFLFMGAGRLLNIRTHDLFDFLKDAGAGTCLSAFGVFLVGNGLKGAEKSW